MFKLQKNPTFRHPVTVQMPTDAGHDAQSFAATFKVVPDDDLEDFDTTTSDGLKDWLRHIVIELHDIVDENDQPIPHSPELMREILAYPFSRMGLLRAYREGMTGAKAKN